MMVAKTTNKSNKSHNNLWQKKKAESKLKDLRKNNEEALLPWEGGGHKKATCVNGRGAKGSHAWR